MEEKVDGTLELKRLGRRYHRLSTAFCPYLLPKGPNLTLYGRKEAEKVQTGMRLPARATVAVVLCKQVSGLCLPPQTTRRHRVTAGLGPI